MNHRVIAAVMFAELVDLGVAVVACRDAIVRPGGLDLFVFQFPVRQPLFLEAGLEKTTPAAATVVVRLIGCHVDKVLFAHDGFDHEPQIVGNGVSVGLAYDLAGILDGELDLQVLVPVGVGLEFALPDPFGVVFVNVLDLEFVFDVEFFQSCQD